jgi:hypothetical protein
LLNCRRRPSPIFLVEDRRNVNRSEPIAEIWTESVVTKSYKICGGIWPRRSGLPLPMAHRLVRSAARRDQAGRAARCARAPESITIRRLIASRARGGTGRRFSPRRQGGLSIVEAKDGFVDRATRRRAAPYRTSCFRRAAV